MIDHAAMGSAIYSAMTAAATVTVYDTIAAQGATFPYAIVQMQAAAVDYTFTSNSVKADYSLRVVSKRAWPGEARVIYGHLHNILQDKALTVSGYALMRCRRSALVEYSDRDGFWYSGGLYTVEFHS